MRLILVDAYDSFTYNLAQGFRSAGAEVEVVSCDEVDASGLRDRAPDGVVFGPGPGRPEEAGCFVPAIGALLGHVPLLGVCLGHQAMSLALGGTLATFAPVHGRTSAIHHDGSGLFEGLPADVEMTRYHSLGVVASTLPGALRVTAYSDDGVIMGLAHRYAPAWGVQFHPESVLSGVAGQRLLQNFVETSRAHRRGVPAMRGTARAGSLAVGR